MANFASTYHWNIDVSQYNFNMTITGVILIDGIEQTSNTLEIGAFYGDECRGREKLVYDPTFDRYFAFLTLYGEEGNLNSFRLYDHSTAQEFEKTCFETVTFHSDDDLGSLSDPFMFHFGDLQNTSFVEGWNWYSTYIEQEGANGLEMLESSLGGNGIYIRSQNSGYTEYYEDYDLWYGSLTSINNENSYLVNANTPCQVSMVGAIANPAQHPITLNSSGWTWIGYPVTYTMEVNNALSNVPALEGDILKAKLGYSIFYEDYGWYGTLDSITPGSGLMYRSDNTQPVTFTYPNEAKPGSLKKNRPVEPTHWNANHNAYPTNMTVTAIVKLDDEELRSDRYELAAFANGECRGSVRLKYVEPLNRHIAFLTIAGEDVATLNFALYDADAEMEYLSAEENLSFEINANIGKLKEPFTISFRGLTSMDEVKRSLNAYPNPVNSDESFQIDFLTETEGPIRMEVINTLGSVLWNETFAQMPTNIKAPHIPGIYTIRISTENKGSYYCKLVVR